MGIHLASSGICSNCLYQTRSWRKTVTLVPSPLTLKFPKSMTASSLPWLWSLSSCPAFILHQDMENIAFVLSTYLPPLDKFNMYWAEGGRGSLGAGVFLRKGSLCAPLPVLGWILTVREGMTKQKKGNKQKRCLRDLKTEPIYVLLSRWSERWQVLGKNPHTQHGTETVQ